MDRVLKKINGIQVFLGALFFFFFFAGLFNGLSWLVFFSAVLGLATNFLISRWVEQKNSKKGLQAAFSFSSPALLLTLMSLGDLTVDGQIKPLLFWLSSGLITMIAGWLGTKTLAR